MAAILVFFCFHANWPLWLRSRSNILLNFTFESEAIRANLHGNKRILKWRPFWNKVYILLWTIFFGKGQRQTSMIIVNGESEN